MRTIQWVAAAAAVSLALPVLATPTTTSYDFNSVNGTTNGTTKTGGTVYSTFGDAASYNGLYNGGYFGNSATFTAGGVATTVTAWASTGTYGVATPTAGTYASGVNNTAVTNNTQVSNGQGGTTNNTTNFTNGTIENAVLSSYSVSNGGTGTYSGTGNALAETSRNTNGGYGNHDFTCYSGSPNTCTPDTPQHAVDNSGAYEALLFSFAQAVTLSTVTLGYPSVGSGNAGSSDLTVLYCKGTDAQCASSNFANQTFYQLVSSNIWGYTDVLNLSSTNDTGSVGANINSKYWMVGAYIADLPNQSNNDGNADYVKIRALAICTNGSSGCATGGVPEPGSIALLGIAGAGLILNRRRRAVRNV